MPQTSKCDHPRVRDPHPRIEMPLYGLLYKERIYTVNIYIINGSKILIGKYLVSIKPLSILKPPT